MAANALAKLGAEAEIADREDLDEAAGLDGEADIADRGADIVFLALVLEADRRAEIEGAVAAEEAEADAVVRRLERHRRAFAAEAENRERVDAVGIGARIFGIGLRAGADRDRMAAARPGRRPARRGGRGRPRRRARRGGAGCGSFVMVR